MKLTLATASLALLTLSSCSTPEYVRENPYSTIESYRRLETTRPDAVSIPERHVESGFGYSYARPDGNVEAYYPEWQMSKAAAMSRGVFVFQTNPLDPDLVEAGFVSNIAQETNDINATLNSFKQRFPSDRLVSFEQITIDGHPAAIAEYKLTNPLNTVTMYQCLIPDSIRSVSLIGYAPENAFSTYKQTFRKMMLSTKLEQIDRKRLSGNGNGDGC